MAISISIATHNEGAKVTFTNPDGSEAVEPLIIVTHAAHSFEVPDGVVVQVRGIEHHE